MQYARGLNFQKVALHLSLKLFRILVLFRIMGCFKSKIALLGIALSQFSAQNGLLSG